MHLSNTQQQASSRHNAVNFAAAAVWTGAAQQPLAYTNTQEPIAADLPAALLQQHHSEQHQLATGNSTLCVQNVCNGYLLRGT
jgi:hypothetical protein